MKIKTHIYYDPKGRGIRTAIAYIKKRLVFKVRYYGYFIGYSGGQTYTDYFFKVLRSSINKTEFSALRFWEEGDKNWIYVIPNYTDSGKVILKEEKELLFKAFEAVRDFLNPDEICELDKRKLELFEKVIQDEDVVYYYETPKFSGKLLSYLSKYWCLLVSY